MTLFGTHIKFKNKNMEYRIKEGRVTDEELSKYFTQKTNIWKTNA